MNLKPIITEKSLKDAKSGNYTFRVDKRLNKYEIKRMIGELFDVHVVSIRTISEHGEIKKNMMRRKKVIKPSKKAIVTLREKEKIALFDTKD